MEEGGLYAMNLAYDHSVVNYSDTNRIHMIIARHDGLDDWKKLMNDAAERQNIKGEYKIIDDLP